MTNGMNPDERTGNEWDGVDRRNPTRGERTRDFLRRWAAVVAICFGLYAIYQNNQESKKLVKITNTLVANDTAQRHTRVTSGQQRCDTIMSNIIAIKINHGVVPPRMNQDYTNCEALLAKYKKADK